MELGHCVRDMDVRGLVDLGHFAEGEGYAEVYVPDSARGAQRADDGKLSGRDAFCGLAAIFAATREVRGGVEVAAVPMHLPMSLALLASTLQEVSEGRFSLGIGISHAELARAHGLPFPKQQLATMANWLDTLREHSREGVAFGGGWPVQLAALGPKMVRLGAERADGLVLNWLSPEHARKTVDSVRAAAPPGTRPRNVLYLRLMPKAAALRDAVNYDALVNYHRHFVAQGLEGPEQIATATTLPLEDLGAARARIAEYRESGLDLLCLYPHALEPKERNQALAALNR